MINQTPNQFIKRHIGITPTEEKEMLKTIGVNSIDQLIDETVPTNIMMHGKLNIPSALSEFEYQMCIRDREQNH